MATNQNPNEVLADIRDLMARFFAVPGSVSGAAPAIANAGGKKNKEKKDKKNAGNGQNFLDKTSRFSGAIGGPGFTQLSSITSATSDAWKSLKDIFSSKKDSEDKDESAKITKIEGEVTIKSPLPLPVTFSTELPSDNKSESADIKPSSEISSPVDAHAPAAVAKNAEVGDSAKVSHAYGSPWWEQQQLERFANDSHNSPALGMTSYGEAQSTAWHDDAILQQSKPMAGSEDGQDKSWLAEEMGDFVDSFKTAGKEIEEALTKLAELLGGGSGIENSLRKQEVNDKEQEPPPSRKDKVEKAKAEDRGTMTKPVDVPSSKDKGGMVSWGLKALGFGS